jgi:hypothetical protein
MQNNIVKTETVAEFLARGGKIQKVDARVTKRTYSKRNTEVESMEDVDMSFLPEALKIKYGIR